MPLFRILMGVLVLAVAALVLSFVFNLLKALLIVGVAGIALGIFFALRPRRRPPPSRRLGE